MFIIMNDCDKELSLELGVKGLSGNSEHFGCTRDVAVAFIHDLPDVIVLEIFQGCHFRIVVDGVLEHPYQFVIIPGLGNEIGGSAFQSLDGKLHVGKGGDEYHGDVGVEPAEGAEPEQAVLTAVYAEREVHVEQDEIYLLLLQQRGGGIGAGQGENPFERIAQTDLQRREYRRIIVDDKKGSIFHIFNFFVCKSTLFFRNGKQKRDCCVIIIQ